MTTRPYIDCLAQALALCGVPDANTAEVARVKTFINRRARQAYAESELWPRWLVVGEERVVSSDGLLPYEEDGLRDIGTIQRIHESQPFLSDPAAEYVDWTSQSDGVQITGYQPAEHSGFGNLQVTGDATFRIYDWHTGNVDMPLPSLYLPAEDFNGSSAYSNTGGDIGSGPSVEGLWVGVYKDADINQWVFNAILYGNGGTNYWIDDGQPYDSPEDARWISNDPNNTGSFTVDVVSDYAAFVTYKAAFSTTYGTGDGEESEVPEEWFEWMATGAAASFLFSDKETEAALLLEAQAREDLDAQLAKVSRQNGNKVQTRILTHSNMQAR